MSKIYVVCQSITSAQKIMNIISKNGFWVTISRTPSELRLKACSYSVIFYEKDAQSITKILRSRNFQNLNMYLLNDGFYKKLEEISSDLF